MSTSNSTHAYIGVDKCGCIRAVTVDNPAHKKEVRKDVMDIMKWGTIERVLIESARIRLCFDTHSPHCPHPNACPHVEEGPNVDSS